MAEEPQKEPTLLQQLARFPSRNLEHAPSFSGQMDALGREALKDVNDKLHQVFFGQSAGVGEPGTPLVPTQAMVTQDLGTVHGYNQMLDGYASRAGDAREQDRGSVER